MILIFIVIYVELTVGAVLSFLLDSPYILKIRDGGWEWGENKVLFVMEIKRK